jgi:hypothetical protein
LRDDRIKNLSRSVCVDIKEFGKVEALEEDLPKRFFANVMEGVGNIPNNHTD